MDELFQPQELGLPQKFKKWRPDQWKAICHGTDSDKRFIGQAAPTGAGKSITAVSQAILLGGRTLYLTATKGLQNQLVNDMGSIGLVDVRGRNNYDCIELRGLSCEEGSHIQCQYIGCGCGYTEAVRLARESSLVVTNYSYWMAQNRYGGGIGDFDLLVCDEAHDAPDEVCAAMAVDFTNEQAYKMLGSKFPVDGCPFEEWRQWARHHHTIAKTRLDGMKKQIEGGDHEPGTAREVSRWKRLESGLATISQAEGAWEYDVAKHGYHLEPLWPAQYAPRILFKGIKKVILTSATLVPKTLDILGIGADEREFYEYPSPFPPRNSPVYYIPTCKVDRSMVDGHKQMWMNTIDMIIRDRLDRKGLIHTVSYERRNYIVEHSAHHNMFVTHETRSVQEAVDLFRRGRPGLVMVSPSLTTGWDFPMTDCEYQIVAKVPFPDTSSRIMRARAESDDSYIPYLTAQTLVQSVPGRAMRAVNDRAEAFIIDDNIRWFLAANREQFPRWWRSLYHRRETVPKPPPRLAG